MSQSAQPYLGEVLIRHGVLSPERLDALVATQRERGGVVDLRELVVATNAADEAAVAQALAAEAVVPYLPRIDVEAVPTAVAIRLPISYAKQHRVLALDEGEASVRVVLADPFDVAAVDDVRALFGKPVEAFVAGGSAVVDAINRVYERADQGGGELQGE
ncbi:MAG TPA: type II secretion system protein GspE, partial [Polyangiaceae bacterium]|nr:type II secretion system protein GspE [Polyangiaceae bacterium]